VTEQSMSESGKMCDL